MSKDYQFVSTDAAEIVAGLIAGYERITGRSIAPASAERLFIAWVADVIVQERAQLNYAANQNIPSRASGANLDALGEELYLTARPDAQAAVCTERFFISEAQQTAVLVPQGTRVTDASGLLVWRTVADAYILPGEIYADVEIRCDTVGTVGNGYAVSQINTVMDVYPYYTACMNITESDGGADRASDEEYYELLRASPDALSPAGAQGAYVYYAKRVSTEIADVIANSPEAGCVAMYVLMKDGKPAGEEIKQAALEACEGTARPIGIFLEVKEPEIVDYNISIKYYIPSDAAKSSAEIQRSVDAAVDEYITWQSAKFGRDINPSHLIQMLMSTGIKRVEVIEPTFTPLRDGKTDDAVPQIARLGSRTVENGGFEDA